MEDSTELLLQLRQQYAGAIIKGASRWIGKVGHLVSYDELVQAGFVGLWKGMVYCQTHQTRNEGNVLVTCIYREVRKYLCEAKILRGRELSVTPHGKQLVNIHASPKPGPLTLTELKDLSEKAGGLLTREQYATLMSHLEHGGQPVQAFRLIRKLRKELRCAS